MEYDDVAGGVDAMLNWNWPKLKKHKRTRTRNIEIGRDDERLFSIEIA